MNESIDRKASFAYFVYPFLFDANPDDKTTFKAISHQVDAASLSGKKVWQKHPFPVN